MEEQSRRNANVLALKENLKNELKTIKELNHKNSINKNYLMNVLEEISNNFNEDLDIEESYLLPELFRKLNTALSKCNANELCLNELQNNLSDIIDYIANNETNFYISDIEGILQDKLNLYNKNKFNSKDSIIRNNLFIEGFISSSSMCIENICQNLSYSKKELIRKFKEDRLARTSVTSSNNNETSDSNSDTSVISANSTLLISEKENSIFLPYTVEEVKDLSLAFEETLEDVIRKNFIIPMDRFKNPTISRFRETFKLVRNKSNGTFTEAISFSLEVMFLHNLNPAIIIACKNTDELREYLNCLKEDKLDLFSKFKVKFEINPAKNTY